MRPSLIWKLSIGCLLLLIAIVAIKQLSSPQIQEIASPAGSQDRVLFAGGGFTDLSVLFYAKPQGSLSAEFIGDMEWKGKFQWAGLVWSRDGTVAACRIILDNQRRTAVYGGAYDFKNGTLLQHNWAGALQADNTPSDSALNWSQGIRQLLIDRGGELESEVDVVKGGGGAVTRTAWFWEL